MLTIDRHQKLDEIYLAESIGFHHLLDLSCTFISKSVILWLAYHFNVLTRTFIFPNGYKTSIKSLAFQFAY
jgi:hypothetical protein